MTTEILVMAFDGLDPYLVEKAGCGNLRQTEFGTTDISEYDILHSMLIWPELLTGRNMERELTHHLYEFRPNSPSLKNLSIRLPRSLSKIIERQLKEKWTGLWERMWRQDRAGRVIGNLWSFKKMFDESIWTVKLPHELTLFRHFEKSIGIDVPLFNYDYSAHKEERDILGSYYNNAGDERILKELESKIRDNHDRNKDELLRCLTQDFDLVWFFTPIMDLWGHVNIGRPMKMRKIYREADRLAKEAKEQSRFMMIVSDHGIVRVNRFFGDHRRAGFWSSSDPLGLDKPKLGQLHSKLVQRSQTHPAR